MAVKKDSKGWFDSGTHVAFAVALLLVLIMAAWFGLSYNGLVKADVDVDASWGQVEVVYQRRADLIPNLVATVEGAKNFEQETLLAVTRARTGWNDAGTPEEKVVAANQLEAATKSFIDVVVERYPEIKSTQNFLALQDELASTENKVAVERGRYNEAVRRYNTKVRAFPTNIVAGISGFGQRTFFEASKGAENAPQVNFS